MDRETLRAIERLFQSQSNRLKNAIVRGKLRLADDTKGQQRVQVDGFPGGPADGAELFHAYGFSSIPLEGAEAVIIFAGADRAHPLVVAVSDKRHRPTGGEPGEVTVYNHTGAKLTITKDGDFIAEPADGRAFLVRSPGGTAVELATKADVEAVDSKYAAHLHGAAGAATTGPLSAFVPGAPPVATPLAPATITGTTVLKGE